ncbi:FhaA domain-containing protein [Desulfovirgula thermocuniculi]|uniref:FhaA domain-containing protein n=1 Tax=Desulfovirgula thermocuniculi TaxID=348842 RepID=UPI0003FA8036|nr:DUF3662 and FHA domain-containing protein [Desulfovirgula thermocuniculi]
MGLFSELEGSLEKYIEGFFRDRFKGRVQPLDMAKRLFREMRDRKRVSISRVYVPNEYIIYLHPEDYKGVSHLAPYLAEELEEYLLQKAREKNFTLVAAPRVEIRESPEVPGGEMRVEASFGQPEDAGTAGTHPGEGEMEDTLEYRPDRSAVPAPACREEVRARLVVTEGPAKGKVFELLPRTAVVGRRETCDLVIDDPSVSRRHARLEYRGGNFILRDLGSTNGVYVNGVRVHSKVLSSGDVIKLGTTLCTFEVD